LTQAIKFLSGGALLAARLFPPSATSSATPAVVIILSGDSPNGLKSKTWPPLIEGLNHAGLNVFGFDFHSQGDSEGDRADLSLTVGCRNFLDAYAALEKLIDLDKCRIGLLGSSFGAAVLLESVAQVRRYDAIGLKSPASFLAESYETEHGFSGGMSEWRKTGISSVTGLSYRAYIDAIKHNTYEKALLVNRPVLIVHGIADEIVPITQSRRLSHLLGPQSTLVELPDVDHHYRQAGAQEVLQDALIAFFAQVLLGSKAGQAQL
jgi:uncharacterized protein